MKSFSPYTATAQSRGGMKKHLWKLLLLCFSLAASAHAQLASGTIQTYGASCASSNCVTTAVPFSAVILSVQVSNPFSGNILVEESFDNGQTWATVNTITTQVTSSYVVSVPTGAPVVTNFRLRADSWTSGQAAVKISSFGAAQPISGSVVAVQPSGSQLHMTCDSGCGGPNSVSVTNFPASQPVTGTFWQPTQPVSLLSVPTHSVTVTNFPATQPVSGTFWQPTQPVSLLSVPTHAVTQSGAWTDTVVQPTGANLHADVDLIAGANPCINPTATLQSFTGTTAATTLTQIVPLSGTAKIYICSLFLVAPSGSPTMQFESGTGTNCATGTAAVTQSVKLSSGSSLAYPSPVAVAPAGAALCYLASGIGVQYQGAFVQQ
jgi:hypothetical protein